jgi:integrase
MARPFKPWYHAKKKAWVIEPQGKLHVLVEGPNDSATEGLAREQLTLYLAKQIELRRANPPLDSGDDHTVASIIEASLLHDEKHSKPRTYYERARYLQLFSEAHGRKLVKDVKPFHLTTWLDAHPEWSNAATHSYVVRCVKRPFNWAVKLEMINRNPFKSVEHVQGKRRRPITQDEYARLIAAACKKKRLARFVEALRFMRLTGCRPGELRSLCWEHIDLERAVIVLRDHKTVATRKDKAPRVIPLVEDAVRLLVQIRARKDHVRFVFVARGGKPWSRGGLQQNVRRLREEVGLPDDVVVYGIRHDFGTRGVLRGVDIKTLAELMGHTSTRIREHYVHLAGQDRHLADAMRRVAGRS